MTAITNTYREPILPEHKGNPLIEVLPRLCESELLQCWKRKPSFDVSEREKDKRYRRLCLTRLGNSFIWPLEIYLEFYYRVEEALLANYAAKNPLWPSTTHFRHYINPNETIAKPKGGTIKVKGDVITLLGDSGVGKSTMISQVLGVFESTYVHHHYGEHDLAGTRQVIYISVQCPATGSIKTLCQSIAIELEKAAGVPNPVGPKPSVKVEDLMNLVERQVRENFVGIIVLDDIQHLRKTRQGRDYLLRFLLNLVINSGVVMIFSGTQGIEDLLKDEDGIARRSEAGGVFRMDPLSKSQWNGFMKILWRYQWTAIPTPLPQKMSTTLRDLTRGNIDLAIRTFQEAQREAIRSGAEFISLDIINDAFLHACEFTQALISDPISRIKKANLPVQHSKKKVNDVPLRQFCHPQWQDKIATVLDQQLQLNADDVQHLVEAAADDEPLNYLREQHLVVNGLSELLEQ